MTRRGCALLLATLVLWAGAAEAQAVGYRYWSFWDRDGDRWTYASQGPSTAVPSDGDVQGFRFAVSEDSADATQPRGTATFATICARTPAREDRKRVALVIDFGTPKDAPSGETPPPQRTACATVAPDATTAEALASVAKPLRYDTNALLCAISGYPRKGCGEPVTTTDNTAAKNPDDNDTGPSLGLWAGVAGVAALGAAAVWQSRRRKNA
ncbi:SCO2322 family protein [Streptomyces sp. CC219B]|uniref:SCO2322 family protein n=1 Tax=Streptomyces sp. CC219B TaxID=3044574 RepID=UPI0024A88B7B|nr:SCO2322 family protein [Streptomyces sp. CC219B]